MRFDLRRTAVKAMVADQFPWVQVNTIVVTDNTDWSESSDFGPHFHVSFSDDNFKRQLIIKINISEI